MASMEGSSNSNVPDLDQVDENKPLWKYVTKVERIGGGGGNFKFKCTFCHCEYKGSYTRVKAHLLKLQGKGIGVCRKVTSKNIGDMQREIDDAEARMLNSQLKKVPLPPPALSRSFGSMDRGDVDSKKRKTTVGSGSGSGSASAIEKVFSMKERDELDRRIARMFYSAGLPFHLARNPYFIDAWSYAATHNLPGYLPPGYNKLRTTLLNRERVHIDKMVEPLKSKWSGKGVSIVSDGWSDSQRRPMINFIAINSHGPMFLKAIDTSGEIKDKHFIANHLKEVINEVGAQNVVQVITDNASNCKAAGQLIETYYPHIFWTPCVVHTLNLALKNICAARNVEGNEVTFDECHWISDIAGDALMIKNFIKGHSMRLAIYNEYVPLKLLSVADTRFASSLVMLKRFKLIKNGLQMMVISDKWNCYREDDVGKARFVKEKLLDDIWWDQLNYILSFTAPIYDMLRACDTDKPCLHLIYEMWDIMIENVKKAIYKHEGKRLDETSTFFNVVHAILVDRWTKNNTPLHCLAHSLNPRYYSAEWLSEDPSRVAPHYDDELSRERGKCLKRYFDDPTERNKVNLEYAAFADQDGKFADSECIRDMGSMDPRSWWILYGPRAPTLQRVALKVIGQPASSSCAERNWSTYSFIHSVRRNKMTVQRAEDLVFIHSNLRLLSRREPSYVQGETKHWDIAGDGFDSLDEVGVLEIANLTLDEPDIEVGLLNDGVQVEDVEDGEEDVEIAST